MPKNSLPAGDSRIGWAWDAKIPNEYPAMLRNTDGRVELVIPYDESNETLDRRYVGASVTWGDDPDMSRHDYELPEQFWFADARGFVTLIGVRPGMVNPLAGGPSIFKECRIPIDFAIFGGDPGVDHSRINGLETRIQGLGRWFGHRSVQHNLLDPARNRDQVTLTIDSACTEKVDAGLNLSIVAGADWRMPGEVGQTYLEEVGSVRTTVARPRPWRDHIERHRSIHKLLEVSSWRPLGFERVRVMHMRDPDRVLTGKVIGDRWSPVETTVVPSVTDDSRFGFLFSFEDIGAPGIRRWLKLERSFARGIQAMTFSIRHRGTSLDGLISDSGIGLEEIGYQIDLLRGGGNRRGHHAHLLDISREVQHLLPFDGAQWATDSTDVYNDVKHADRRDPMAVELQDMLIKNRLVFRIWLAHRLGVTDAVITSGMWQLRRGLSDS